MTDQEKIELKPCPFCGGRAEIKGGLTVMRDETGSYDSEVYWVECAGSEDVEPCGYKPCEIESDSFEGAAEHWNTRPIEDDICEELEEWKKDAIRLAEYANHKLITGNKCGIYKSPREKCDCGIVNALNAHQALLEKYSHESN